MLDGLPPEAKLIGVFGFLNDYKGFETTIRALYHLPDEYHLLIFGGVHPQSDCAPCRDPSLCRIAVKRCPCRRDALRPHARHADDRPQSRHRATSARPLRQTSARSVGPRPFHGRARRWRFSRPAWRSATRSSSPIWRSGQSSSGPISQALELGCRVIASRTHTFLEFADYHPNTVEFFDIGNHLELAERVAARRRNTARRDRPARIRSRPTRRSISPPTARPTAPPRPFAQEAAASAAGDRRVLISAAATKPRERAARDRSRHRPRSARWRPAPRASAGAISSGCSTRMPRTPKLRRDLGEVGRSEADQLLAPARPIAGDAAHAGQVLAKAGIVVDDDHRRDLVAARRFQLGEVVVEPAIAGEAHDPARCRPRIARRARPETPSRATPPRADRSARRRSARSSCRSRCRNSRYRRPARRPPAARW